MPLQLLAGLTELIGVSGSFTRMALASVSRDNVLDLRKIQDTLGFQPAKGLWSSVPEIVAWANAVGLENVRLAKPGLPWMGFEAFDQDLSRI